MGGVSGYSLGPCTCTMRESYAHGQNRQHGQPSWQIVPLKQNSVLARGDVHYTPSILLDNM